MTILIDMNLSPLWVEYLRTHGIESTHWSSIGRADAFDHEIMDFAVAHHMVVLTHDLDFGALLAMRKTRQPSVVQVRAQNILPDAIGSLVVAAFRTASDQILAGALVTVDPDRNRIRLLPLNVL